MQVVSTVHARGRKALRRQGFSRRVRLGGLPKASRRPVMAGM